MATEKHYLDKDGLSYLKTKMDETYAAKSELETAKQELQTSIDGKAESSHQHVAADITDANETWASKTHSHTIADVTDLQTQLATLQTNMDAIPQAPIEVTVDTADWGEGEGVVSKAFTATGVNNASNTAYVAGLKQGTEGDKAARETFGNIVRGVVTAENELTLYSLKAPTTQITLLLVPFSTQEPVAEVLGLLGGGGGSGGGGAVAGNDISGATITLKQDSFPYDGAEHTPEITKVELGGRQLIEGTDYYVVSNESKINAGTYGVVIVGILQYSGSASKQWSITRIDPKLTLSAETITITGIMGTSDSSITVSHEGDGAITFEVTDGEDGGSVTAELATSNIKLTSKKAGTCTVKVKLAQGTNHTAAEKDIAVTVNKATGSISASPAEVSLSSDVGSTVDVTLTVTGDGAISVTGGESYVTGKVDETRKKLTLTTVAATEEPQTLTVTLAATDNYTGATCTVKVTIQNGKIYGVTWDGTASTKWSRTDDAVGFTDPVPYDAGTHKTGYSSPFDACKPWSEMKRETDATCGEMVRIPKFWYELKQNGNGLSIRISDHEGEDGFKVAPAFMHRSGSLPEVDYILVGRYHCSSTDYKSTTAKAPKASITRSAARDAIKELDSTGHVIPLDLATWFTIWLLYLVEFANWDSQSTIGYGCGNNSSVENTGKSDTMPYHTGTMQTDKTTYGVGVQYRWIEDPWGNVYDWLDGCYYNANGLYAIIDPTKFSDTSNGTLVGKPASSGYPSKLTVSTSGGFPMFYPTASSGSESTYTCDYWYFDGSSYPVLCVGGDYGRSRNRGLFLVNDQSASGSDSNVGARLLKIPSGGV